MSTIFTRQLREIAGEVRSGQRVAPDRRLDVMERDQGPSEVLIGVMKKLAVLFGSEAVDRAPVQGNPVGALAGALGAGLKHPVLTGGDCARWQGSSRFLWLISKPA